MKIKNLLFAIIILLFGIVVGLVINLKLPKRNSEAQQIVNTVIPKPLERYTIDNLKNKVDERGQIVIDPTPLEENDNFDSYIFEYKFDPTLEGKAKKTVTGLINIPNDQEKHPIALMIRGYVNQETYTIGEGTKRDGEFLANNGYITIAPDFLGYAGSDSEASNIFESRFQTYTTVESIINSFDSIESWDNKNIFVWGHSNGGQIALTLLEITRKDLPTVLWAPVSKPFPYSVLYYTDESDDNGKFIRSQLANFENLYDADLYSLTNYFDYITAPIQLNHGTADDAVPKEWSDNLAKVLKSKDLDTTYYTYPGANHNLSPGWDTAIQRTLSFFNSHLKD